MCRQQRKGGGAWRRQLFKIVVKLADLISLITDDYRKSFLTLSATLSVYARDGVILKGCRL